MEIKPLISEFHYQFKKGINCAENIKAQGHFNSVTVCGMGGSSWPAEIMRDWLNPSFPFFISKTYSLPSQANKNSLILICSYSGNTDEPLSCYKEAKKLNLPRIGITTGGKLKDLCKRDGTPLVLMPNDVPAPRLGCGYTFGAIAAVLSNSGLIKDKSIEIISAAEKLKTRSLEKEGKKLAEKIFGKTPLIYSTDKLKTLSYIWKIKFNETSKMPAFCNFFPELDHNELSAYIKIKNDFSVIILRDGEDMPEIKKRILLTSRIIKSKGVPVEIIDLKGDGTLEKILNNISLADWSSYYLALKNNVDPLSVDLQESLKKKLKNK